MPILFPKVMSMSRQWKARYQKKQKITIVIYDIFTSIY